MTDTTTTQAAGTDQPALTPLATWNAQAEARAYNESHSTKPTPNGIACPTCGHELLDSCPMQEITTNTPLKRIRCPNCGYKGTRVA